MSQPGEIDFLNVDRKNLIVYNQINNFLHLNQINSKKAFINFKADPSKPDKYASLRAYMQAVQNLSFTEDPDYELLRSILKNLTVNYAENL